MKKIISLVVALTVICSAMVLPMGSAAAEGEYDNAYALLRVLEVIPNNDLASTAITRADFAVYCARTLGVNDFEQNDTRYYVDVPMDHYAAKAINYLASMGILTVGEDKEFRPNDIILRDEALKMLVVAMGYKQVAEMSGGFPAGYLRVAQRLGIMSSGIPAGELSTENACQILYNALTEPIADITGANNQGLIREETGETLLSAYHDIYFGKGTVTGVNGRYLYQDKTTDVGMMTVGGAQYVYADNQYNHLLGSTVTFYYRKDKLDRNEIVHIKKDDTQQVTISIEDMAANGYSRTSIKYYKGGTEKSISLENNAVVVYNGRPLTSAVSATMNSLNYGTIVVKQMGRGYDVVLVTDYSDMYSTTKDSKTQKIYDYSGSRVPLDMEEIDVCSITDTEGTLLTYDELTLPAVLSIAMSKDKTIAEIIVSYNTVSGKIASTKKDSSGRRVVSINDTEYAVDSTYYANNGGKFSVGSEYTYCLNFDGKIVYTSDIVASAVKMGYMTACSAETDGFDKIFMVKIYSLDGKFTVYEAAKNVVVDGKSCKNADEIIAAMPNTDPQMIAYKTAGEKINYIDTATEIETESLKTGENEDTALYVKGDINAYDAYAGFGRFGPKYLVDMSTFKMLMVPSNANDDKKYRTESLDADDHTNFNEAGSDFIGIYKIGKSTEYYTYGVTKSEATVAVTDSALYMVKDIYRTMNDDGDVVNALTLIDRTKEGAYTVTDEVLGAITLEKGDAVRIGQVENDIKSIELVYDESESRENRGGYPDPAVWLGGPQTVGANTYNVWLENSSDYRYFDGLGFQTTFGFVAEKTSNTMGWCYKKPVSAATINVDEAYGRYLTGTASYVVVYDSAADEVYRGSINDVKDYKTYGDNCSKVLFFARWGNYCYGIFIYN